MAIDRRERSADATTAMLAVLAGFKSELWTALPGIVQKFNPAEKTCVIQPSLQMRVSDSAAKKTWVNLPLLVDCPVYFPSGGGFTLTFPVHAGDECLVVFASRCIDNWWERGGIQQQAELRMLDLSDGFCFVGVSSKPNVQGAISTNAVELRSNDGTAKIKITQETNNIDVLTPSANVTVQATQVNILASSAVNVNAPTISLTADANVNVTAPAISLTAATTVSITAPTLSLNAPSIGLSAANLNLTGDLSINGASYTQHVHSGVQNGPDNTGAVV